METDFPAIKAAITLTKPPRRWGAALSPHMAELERKILALPDDGSQALPWPDDRLHARNAPYLAARRAGVRISLIKIPDHGRVIVRLP